MGDYIKIGVGILIFKDGKVLLTKRKGKLLGLGTYGSVGGHVEYGEAPTEALKREAREELGIKLGNLKFLHCYSAMMYGKHYIDIMFTGEIISGEPKVLEPDKIESVGWYDPKNLPAPLFDPVRISFEAYNNGQQYFEAWCYEK